MSGPLTGQPQLDQSTYPSSNSHGSDRMFCLPGMAIYRLSTFAPSPFWRTSRPTIHSSPHSRYPSSPAYFSSNPHGKYAGGTCLEARRESKLFLTDSHLLKCIGSSKLSAKVARARAVNCWRHVPRNLWLLLNPQILGPRDHCRRFWLLCMHAALQKK